MHALWESQAGNWRLFFCLVCRKLFLTFNGEIEIAVGDTVELKCSCMGGGGGGRGVCVDFEESV